MGFGNTLNCAAGQCEYFWFIYGVSESCIRCLVKSLALQLAYSLKDLICQSCPISPVMSVDTVHLSVYNLHYRWTFQAQFDLARLEPFFFGFPWWIVPGTFFGITSAEVPSELSRYYEVTLRTTPHPFAGSLLAVAINRQPVKTHHNYSLRSACHSAPVLSEMILFATPRKLCEFDDPNGCCSREHNSITNGAFRHTQHLNTLQPHQAEDTKMGKKVNLWLYHWPIA